ncbi:RES domain-containing protein [Pseudarthrobacter sp. PS3-L1]|uniref:RES domain-containing protein n=1 Tax=Pseudarthrobacter sp. PS3-L1 TaxID=3046207 RepID=UPI0024BA8C88|nr:RES domain-containing protein [Pseudarthrobacter sp. PS3-L1]MDJ0318934.1 RES domain-containing protein [Pseudarthrobacter sp. PS3-L1]
MRVCGKTGLAIVDGPSQAFRVAKESYGPLNPQERGLLSENRAQWYRFDTPGRTVYAAEDAKTALLEALSWARMTASHVEYLKKTANFFGESLATIRKEVEEQWHANGHMAPGWIPANWRDGRLLYTLSFEPGAWIDISHADTLAALNTALGSLLYTVDVDDTLTLAEITGGHRQLTTLLSSWIRDQVLDDGSYPLGIRFPSKHGAIDQGHGYCWAFWLRRADIGLNDDVVSADTGTEIHHDNPAYAFALTRHGIKSR